MEDFYLIIYENVPNNYFSFESTFMTDEININSNIMIISYTKLTITVLTCVNSTIETLGVKYEICPVNYDNNRTASMALLCCFSS